MFDLWSDAAGEGSADENWLRTATSTSTVLYVLVYSVLVYSCDWYRYSRNVGTKLGVPCGIWVAKRRRPGDMPDVPT